MKILKKLSRIIFGRTTFTILSLAIQILFFYYAVFIFKEYSPWLTGGSRILSFIVTIYILNTDDNPSFKIAWIIPVLLMPVFGTLIYLFFQLQLSHKIMKHIFIVIKNESKRYLMQDEKIINKLEKEEQDIFKICNYVKKSSDYPVYSNTEVIYYPLGDDVFSKMKEELLKAEKYIFLEYFIISKGKMWSEILEILKQKVEEGVLVRVMYDGTNSVVNLPYDYKEELKSYGIEVRVFSPIRPVISTYQNNRDHRKILVIDGKKAFSGGINLADEYINERIRFGHWKDNAIYFEGEAVKSFVVMFMQMWNATGAKEKDYSIYFSEHSKKSDGFILPYADNPLDNNRIGKNIYLDLIHSAKKYIYIMTPYFIVDDEMLSALRHASESGVETILLLPKIPDKKYANMLAKTYYKELILSGVKIFEYTKGFVHSKVMIVDGLYSTVGTVNLDYRSLYLHFECGSLLYKSSAIKEVEYDFLESIEKSEKITMKEYKKIPIIERMIGRILRLIAPLM